MASSKHIISRSTRIMTEHIKKGKHAMDMNLIHFPEDAGLSSKGLLRYLDAVERSGLDYLALGHSHSRDIQVIGKTTVVNPGCPMGRGFDETGPKGVCYAELENGVCRVEPLNLGFRVYESLCVPVGEDPLAAVEAALPENTQQDIYRITLTGTCPAPDLEALRTALAPRFYGLELVDNTQPPLELWKDLGEDSLKGEYLRQLKACYDAEEDERTRRLVAEAAKLGVALMEGREVPEL